MAKLHFHYPTMNAGKSTLLLQATMVIRRDDGGGVIVEGAQMQVGGNETHVSLCRRHWREAVGR